MWSKTQWITLTKENDFTSPEEPVAISQSTRSFSSGLVLQVDSLISVLQVSLEPVAQLPRSFQDLYYLQAPSKQESCLTSIFLLIQFVSNSDKSGWHVIPVIFIKKYSYKRLCREHLRKTTMEVKKVPKTSIRNMDVVLPLWGWMLQLG